MGKGEKFTMTPDHILLLRNAWVWWDDCEAGAPAIDCKRPYGNSDVAGDVARILGWELNKCPDCGTFLTTEQHERAWEIHRETETALQLFLLGHVSPGTYECVDWRTWHPVAEEEPYA